MRNTPSMQVKDIISRIFTELDIDQVAEKFVIASQAESDLIDIIDQAAEASSEEAYRDGYRKGYDDCEQENDL